MMTTEPGACVTRQPATNLDDLAAHFPLPVDGIEFERFSEIALVSDIPIHLAGFATTFDETRRSTKIQPRRAGAGQDTEGRGSGSSATLHDDESVLVPWVNLKAPSNAPTSPR